LLNILLEGVALIEQSVHYRELKQPTNQRSTSQW